VQGGYGLACVGLACMGIVSENGRDEKRWV